MMGMASPSAVLGIKLNDFLNELSIEREREFRARRSS